MVLHRWVKTNSVMLINAGSLIGTTAVTSMLGFVYWWLAARHYMPEVVGLASASISAMQLLGTFCILGLGTLLVTELPRQPHKVGALISTALIVVGIIGGAIGIVFSLLAPYVSAQFLPLRATIQDILIFALGISLTAITMVLDQALIGLLLGGLQLWRNALFALAKLAALLVASMWLAQATDMTIYATWTLGNALSLLILAGAVWWKGRWSGRVYRPQWSLLRKLGPAALQHHLLNLTLQATSQVLPVLVTILFSAKMNAWFYVSSTIANFIFVVSSALALVLQAMSSAQQSNLGHRARMTVGLAFVISVVAICLLQCTTKQVLGLFGSAYAEQASGSLRILSLGAFPIIVRNHYITICRIQGRMGYAMRVMVPGGLLELVAASLGAHIAGLSGLSLGWIIALYIEAAFMLRTVYTVLRSKDATEQDIVEQEVPARIIDTTVLAVLGPGSDTQTTQMEG